MKKVIFVLHSIKGTGSILYTSRYINHLANRFNTCKILVVAPDKTDHLFAATNIHCINIKKSYEQSLQVPIYQKVILRASYFIRFLRLLYKERPQLVIGNTICTHYEVLLSKLFKHEAIFFVHEGYSFLSQYSRSLFFSQLLGIHFIAVSSYVQDSLLRFGIKPSYVTVIYNGVPRNPCRPSHHFRSPLSFSLAASIDKNKSQMTALQAFRILKDTFPDQNHTLRLYGDVSDQNYFSELSKYISCHSLEGVVRYFGYIDDPKSIYEHTDCLILCSKDEAFPLVILEAMAYSIPVIASSVGGVPEQVKHDFNGFIFPADNPQKLAHFIEVYIRNPSKLYQHGQNAYIYASTNFDLQRQMNALTSAITRHIP